MALPVQLEPLDYLEILGQQDKQVLKVSQGLQDQPEVQEVLDHRALKEAPALVVPLDFPD